MTKTGRWSVKQILGWVLGLGLLVFLLARMPLRHLPQMLASVAPQTLALTVLGLCCSYILRAARLQTVLPAGLLTPGPRILGLDWRVLKVIFLHNGAVNVIPMRAGELTFPWLAQRHLGLPQAVALATLLWMRLQDLVVLASLGLILLPALDLTWRLGLWCCGLAALALLRHWAIKGAQAQAKAPSPASTTLLPVVATLRQALADPTHHSLASWVFSSANWCVKLAAGGLLLSSLTQLSWHSGLTGALGGELAAVLPVQGPAGLGTYELGVSLGVHWASAQACCANVWAAVPNGAAVWAALILHVVMLCSALLCAALAPLIPTPKILTSTS